MSEHNRPTAQSWIVLTLAIGIAAYLLVQSLILVETGGRETDRLVRTAWFVVLAVGILLGIFSTLFD